MYTTNQIKILIPCFIFVLLCVLPSCKTASDFALSKNAEAMKLWESGNKDAAIEAERAAVKDSPAHYDFRIQLGTYYHATGKYAEAVAEFNEAINLQPSKAEAWLLAGESIIAIARSQDGEESFQTYLSAQHKFSQVIDLLKSETENKNFQFRAKLGKGVCLLRRTLKEDAKPLIEECFAMNPDDMDASFYKAVLRDAQLGANKASIDTYESVLKKNFKHTEALRQMGDMYLTRELTETTRDYYEKFIAAGGKSNTVKEWLAQHPKVTSVEGSSKIPEKEIIMVCPECGRIGKKGQSRCDFDGADLIPKQ